MMFIVYSVQFCTVYFAAFLLLEFDMRRRPRQIFMTNNYKGSSVFYAVELILCYSETATGADSATLCQYMCLEYRTISKITAYLHCSLQFSKTAQYDKPLP